MGFVSNSSFDRSSRLIQHGVIVPVCICPCVYLQEGWRGWGWDEEGMGRVWGGEGQGMGRGATVVDRSR